MPTNGLLDLPSLVTLALSTATNASISTTSTALITAELLQPLQLLTASSSQASSLSDSIEQIQGTFTFSNGSIISNVTSPFGDLQETISVSELASELTASVQQINGTLDFANGFVAANLATPIGLFQDSYALAEPAGDLLNEYLDQIEAVIPFENGQFRFESPTPSSAITGTINFANGQFVTDLTTPFGPIAGSLDFPDDAQYSFAAGDLAGVVDFAQGQVNVLIPGLPGSGIAVPLNSLSGTVSLEGGQATVDIPTPFGSVSTNFDLSQLVDDFVTESLQLTGRLSFDNGVLVSDLTGPLGTFAGTFDLVESVNEAAAFLTQVQGTVSLAGGLLTSNLTTPSGPFEGTLDLSALAEEL